MGKHNLALSSIRPTVPHLLHLTVEAVQQKLPAAHWKHCIRWDSISAAAVAAEAEAGAAAPASAAVEAAATAVAPAACHHSRSGETSTRWKPTSSRPAARHPTRSLSCPLFSGLASGRSSFPLKFEAFLELANFLPNSIVEYIQAT